MEENKEQEILEEEVTEAVEEEVTTEEVTEEEAPAAEEATEEEPKKKKFKKEKKDKKDEKIAELTDQVMRQMAEFQNFRNRTEREKAAMFETGAKSIIEKLLPVIDNFERAFAGKTDEDIAADPFMDGMNKVYKQMTKTLEDAGVKAIEAEGKEFDPNLHNAVMQVSCDGVESGFVVQELQKGYTYRDSVVRHSMVSVAE